MEKSFITLRPGGMTCSVFQKALAYFSTLVSYELKLFTTYNKTPSSAKFGQSKLEHSSLTFELI